MQKIFGVHTRNDIIYAVGRFRAEPLATFIIILTLALGIGATTAIFSVVNGVLLNAAPFADAERLVTLRQFQPDVENSRMGLSAKEIFDYSDQATNLSEVAEYHNMTFTMYGHGDPQRVNTGVVSSNFFPMLGIEPVLGRLFAADEDAIGSEPLLLLTYEYWVEEFGSDPGIVGQTVEMNNRAHEIIGVLQRFPQFPNVNDVYMAVPSCPWRSGDAALSNRNARFLVGYGKIKEGATMAQTQAELSTIASRISTSFPEDYPQEGSFDSTATSLVDDLVQGSRSYLFVLLGTTVLVLLISSANVTNLVLSQHARRQREFAVRSSLGATRLVLGKQLLTESMLLAFAAGLLGLGFAYIGLDILQGFAQHFTSRANQIEIDLSVMLFTLVVSLATGIIAGILPSLAKQQLVTALKEGGKSSYSTRGGPVRSGLLIAQFSLSLTLLVAAAMAIKSLQEIREVDPGYITSNVKAIQLDLNWTTYGDNASRWQVTQSIMNALENLNEVSKAAAAFTYPMDTVMAGFGQIRQSISLDDRPFNPNDILSNTYSRSVSYNYFDVLGIQLKQGRPFSRHDTADDLRVIIINQSLAKQYWPDESAVNHKVSFDNGASWNTIVGVVDDVLEQGLNVDATNQIYRPMAQSPSLHVALLVKTTEDKTGANVNAGVSHADLTLNRRFQDNVREIIRLEDVQQAISKIESLQQALVNSMSLQTFIAQVLTVFAGIAMFITVSGISGVLGYMVSVRTREIGIRMAIGANQRDVLLMILLYGLKLSVTGLALGIVGAWWIAEQLNEHLYNVSSHDVGIYIISLTIMLAVTIGASLLPSYQASTMNPNRALKAT